MTGEGNAVGVMVMGAARLREFLGIRDGGVNWKHPLAWYVGLVAMTLVIHLMGQIGILPAASILWVGLSMVHLGVFLAVLVWVACCFREGSPWVPVLVPAVVFATTEYLINRMNPGVPPVTDLILPFIFAAAFVYLTIRFLACMSSPFHALGLAYFLGNGISLLATLAVLALELSGSVLIAAIRDDLPVACAWGALDAVVLALGVWGMFSLMKLKVAPPRPAAEAVAAARRFPEGPVVRKGRVTNIRIWKCPRCEAILEKKGLGTVIMAGETASKIVGTATCSGCGATFSQTDIYAGVYDHVESTRSVKQIRAPHRLALIVFRAGTDQPRDPQAYCRHVLKQAFGSDGMEVSAWRIAGTRSAMSAGEARALYATGKDRGMFPDFGKPESDWSGKGSDQRDVTALFFKA